MMTVMTAGRWAVAPDEEMVGTATLGVRYGVNPKQLWQWDQSGLISPATPRNGQGAGNELWWAPWAQRMVSWLSMPAPCATVTNSLKCRVAEALQRYPDAVYLVDTGGPALVPSWDAADATELLLASTAAVPTLVSPPGLPT